MTTTNFLTLLVANLGCCDVNRPCHIGSSRGLFQLPICPQPGLCRTYWQLTVEGEGKKNGRERERERENGREREKGRRTGGEEEQEGEGKKNGRERERERERERGRRTGGRGRNGGKRERDRKEV